jgi:hypothetical protein
MSDEDSCRLRTDLRLPKILKLVIAVGFGHWQSNCFVGTRFFSNTSLDESVGKTELQQAVNRGDSLGSNMLVAWLAPLRAELSTRFEKDRE